MAAGPDPPRRHLPRAPRLRWAAATAACWWATCSPSTRSCSAPSSCGVPLLDMRRYTKLSAGDSWIAEYGDPDVPEQWDFIRTFSPYHLLARRRGLPGDVHLDRHLGRPCGAGAGPEDGSPDAGHGRSLTSGSTKRWRAATPAPGQPAGRAPAHRLARLPLAALTGQHPDLRARRHARTRIPQIEGAADRFANRALSG